MPIPNLPDTWPYEPRTASGSWVRTAAEELGSGWIRIGPSSLDLSLDARALEGAFGRGGVHRRGAVVVRPYRRGGLVRRLNERIYPGPARFQAEAEVHRALWESGFPTVEPLGFAFRPRGIGVEGLYFTRVEEGVPWPAAFARTTELLPQFQVLLQALADWGLRAPDLNATNFLIASGGRLLALDWDRSHWGSRGRRLLRAYLRRIDRSLEKLGAPAEVRKRMAGLG